MQLFLAGCLGVVLLMGTLLSSKKKRLPPLPSGDDIQATKRFRYEVEPILGAAPGRWVTILRLVSFLPPHNTPKRMPGGLFMGSYISEAEARKAFYDYDLKKGYTLELWDKQHPQFAIASRMPYYV